MRVPASCVLYVPEAQGSSPPLPTPPFRAIRARRCTCASLGCAARTPCRAVHHRSSRTASRCTARPGSCRWTRRRVAAASAAAPAAAPAPSTLALTSARTPCPPPQSQPTPHQPTPRAGVRRVVPRDDQRQRDGHRRRDRGGGGEDTMRTLTLTLTLTLIPKPALNPNLNPNPKPETRNLSPLPMPSPYPRALAQARCIRPCARASTASTRAPWPT